MLKKVGKKGICRKRKGLIIWDTDLIYLGKLVSGEKIIYK